MTPVSWSTGTSARPDGAAGDQADGAARPGTRETSPSSAHGVVPARRRPGRPAARPASATYSAGSGRRPAPPPACACRPRRRWGCRAGCWPPGSRRRARRPRPRRTHAARRPRLGLDVRRADHRHQPEEDEDHDLAEPAVAVGPGRRRCRTRRRGCRPRRPPPATRPSSRRAPGRPPPRPRRRANAARFTAAGVAAPEPDEAQRADPVVVGAADAVGVVVGVVDPDLERQRDDQRQRGLPPDHLRRRTPRRRCRPGRARRRRGGCGGGRLRATAPRVATTADPARPRRRAYGGRRDGSLRPGRTGRAAEVLALLRAWDAGRRSPEPLRDRDLRVDRAAQAGGAVPARAARLRRRHPRRLGGPGQWVLNLPPTYVAGLQVLFRSVVAGTDPVVARPARCADARRGDDRGPPLRLAGADPAVPGCSTSRRTCAALPRFDAVLVGGGPLEPAVRARRPRRAGVRGRADLRHGRDLRRLRLRRAAARRRRGRASTTDGQVLLAGRCSSTGTRASRRAPRRCCATAGCAPRTSAARRGRAAADPRPGRRRGDQRRGQGARPRRSRRCSREHPAVATRSWSGVPDPEWGERVVAVVVARPARRRRSPSCATWSTPRAWAPRAARGRRALPQLPNGKVDRPRCAGDAAATRRRR